MITAAVTWTLLACSPTYGCSTIAPRLESQIECFRIAVIVTDMVKRIDPKLAKWAFEVHKGEIKCIPINEELK